MKKIVSVFLFLLSAMFVFAGWSEGYFVDDFGDPTDSHFAYINGSGQFSNSATSNSTMYYKLIVYPYSGDNTEGVTSLKIRFDLHDYGFNNPVHSYYSDTYAYYSIKDEDGNVYKFSKNNKLTPWYAVIGNEAVDIYRLMLKNNSLKIAVSVESSKYVFSVDCDGFKEIIEPVIENTKQKYPLNTWTQSSSQFSFGGMDDWVYCSVYSDAQEYAVKTIVDGHTKKEPEILFSTHQCLEGFVTNDWLTGYTSARFTTSKGSVNYKIKGSSIDGDVNKLARILVDVEDLNVELQVDGKTIKYWLDAREFLEHLVMFEEVQHSLNTSENLPIIKDEPAVSFESMDSGLVKEVPSVKAPSIQSKCSTEKQSSKVSNKTPIEKGDYGALLVASASVPFEYRGNLKILFLRHQMIMPYLAFAALGPELRLPIGITYVPTEGILLYSGIELGRTFGLQAGVSLFYSGVAVAFDASYDFATAKSYFSLGLGLGGYNGEPYRKSLF